MPILKTFLEKFSRRSGPLFDFGTSPEADWKVIFVSALALTLVLSFINVLMFIRIDKGEIFVTDEMSQQENTFDIEKLNGVSLYYQSKAQEFERILNEKSASLVDPSL